MDFFAVGILAIFAKIILLMWLMLDDICIFLFHCTTVYNMGDCLIVFECTIQ